MRATTVDIATRGAIFMPSYYCYILHILFIDRAITLFRHYISMLSLPLPLAACHIYYAIFRAAHYIFISFRFIICRHWHTLHFIITFHITFSHFHFSHFAFDIFITLMPYFLLHFHWLYFISLLALFYAIFIIFID
jgi:hypothetical protein